MGEHKFEVGDAVESIGGLEEAQQPSSPCARDAACGECAKLKRELENAKRERSMFHSEWRAVEERYTKLVCETTTEVAFLKRELERLRKRKPYGVSTGDHARR